MSSAFIPTGKTVLLAAATPAPVGVQAASSGRPPSGMIQYRIHNAGSVTVFLGYGASTTLSQSAAVIPTGTGSSAKDSYPLTAGATEVFSAPKDIFWSGVTTSSTASVYITPGEGL